MTLPDGWRLVTGSATVPGRSLASLRVIQEPAILDPIDSPDLLLAECGRLIASLPEARRTPAALDRWLTRAAACGARGEALDPVETALEMHAHLRAIYRRLAWADPDDLQIKRLIASFATARRTVSTLDDWCRRAEKIGARSDAAALTVRGPELQAHLRILVAFPED